MSDEERARLIGLLKDQTVPTGERAEAVFLLAEDGHDEVWTALLCIASEDDGEVGYAAGKGIAAIAIRQGVVYDVPWWSFTTTADEAFDEAVARHQRAHPEDWNLNRDPERAQVRSTG
jgi:hypothetical protein